MAVKQTAGRKELGEFAPKFAELNDDVLFGEVWSGEDKLSLRPFTCNSYFFDVARFNRFRFSLPFGKC